MPVFETSKWNLEIWVGQVKRPFIIGWLDEVLGSGQFQLVVVLKSFFILRRSGIMFIMALGQETSANFIKVEGVCKWSIIWDSILLVHNFTNKLPSTVFCRIQHTNSLERVRI